MANINRANHFPQINCTRLRSAPVHLNRLNDLTTFFPEGVRQQSGPGEEVNNSRRGS